MLRERQTRALRLRSEFSTGCPCHGLYVQLAGETDVARGAAHLQADRAGRRAPAALRFVPDRQVVVGQFEDDFRLPAGLEGDFHEVSQLAHGSLDVVRRRGCVQLNHLSPGDASGVANPAADAGQGVFVGLGERLDGEVAVLERRVGQAMPERIERGYAFAVEPAIAHQHAFGVFAHVAAVVLQGL